ncbi:SgcJ/EcaC family oxidoreductase [Sphingobium aromaticiconvertens]|uniref:SgcJ/EcaC family oxidoreductase n=1 Tax=Sphingobium aromaticiconvertens TaxID=365341 RepID=UPI00301984D1
MYTDHPMGPAAITRHFQDAWNSHDMEAFGRLFHYDATFVNRFATYWRGVDQIVNGHAAIHASIYSDSTLAIDPPDVDPISDDAAILHFWSRLSVGIAHPAGPHQIDTLILAVANPAQWRVAHSGAGECDADQRDDRRRRPASLNSATGSAAPGRRPAR